MLTKKGIKINKLKTSHNNNNFMRIKKQLEAQLDEEFMGTSVAFSVFKISNGRTGK